MILHYIDILTLYPHLFRWVLVVNVEHPETRTAHDGHEREPSRLSNTLLGEVRRRLYILEHTFAILKSRLLSLLLSLPPYVLHKYFFLIAKRRIGALDKRSDIIWITNQQPCFGGPYSYEMHFFYLLEADTILPRDSPTVLTSIPQ